MLRVESGSFFMGYEGKAAHFCGIIVIAIVIGWEHERRIPQIRPPVTLAFVAPVTRVLELAQKLGGLP